MMINNDERLLKFTKSILDIPGGCSQPDASTVHILAFDWEQKLAELEKLRKLLEEIRKYITGTAYLTPMRIKDLLAKYGL